jgi:hypothetical protein
MYAFQLCSVPNEDQKITHCEFLGCIAEDDDDEDETPEDGEDNKRGIDEVTEDADDSGELSSKRPREAFD